MTRDPLEGIDPELLAWHQGALEGDPAVCAAEQPGQRNFPCINNRAYHPEHRDVLGRTWPLSEDQLFVRATRGEEERARHFVDRAFPEIARFLGHGELPVYGPTEVQSDEGVTPDVIVRVDYALSRDQLVTALGIGFAEIAADRGPETLTAEEVRVEVEGFLGSRGIMEVDDQMERDAQRTFRPEQQRVMQLLAEAVDRAYPVAGAAPARESGTPAPRHGDGTVTLSTIDHGPVTLTCPAWCHGHEGAPKHRVDLAHEGDDVPLTVTVPGVGPVTVATALFEQRPFATRPPGTGVFLNLEIDGVCYPLTPDGIVGVAADLLTAVVDLRVLAARLALYTAQDGGER